MADDLEVVGLKGAGDGADIGAARHCQWWFESKVNEIKAHRPNPFDLLEDLVAGMVHRADLHVKPRVSFVKIAGRRTRRVNPATGCDYERGGGGAALAPASRGAAKGSPAN